MELPNNGHTWDPVFRGYPLLEVILYGVYITYKSIIERFVLFESVLYQRFNCSFYCGHFFVKGNEISIRQEFLWEFIRIYA